MEQASLPTGTSVVIPPIPHGSLIEKIIIGKLVEALLERGFNLSVWDGEAYPLKHSTDRAAIYDALASTDEDRLIAYMGTTKETMIGGVLLIWGNDHHIISDYADVPALRAIVDPICAWAEAQR